MNAANLGRVLLKVIIHLEFLITLFPFSLRAEYVFVRAIHCPGQNLSASPNCKKAIDEKDPEWDDLFAILKKHQWPMSITNVELKHSSLTEDQRIQAAVNHFNQKPRLNGTPVVAHFIPSSLYELHAASDLIGQALSQRGAEKNQLKHFESNDLREVFKDLKSEKECQNQIHDYFDNLDNKLKEDYGKVNASLVNELLKESATGLNLISIGEKNHLRSITHKIYENFNKMDRDVSLLPLPPRFWEPQNLFGDDGKVDHSLEILNQIVDAELQAHANNQALLYRGTNGIVLSKSDFEDLKIECDDFGTCRAIDSPIDLKPVPYRSTKSLSYGASFFAGMFYDAGPKGATAQDYFFPRAGGKLASSAVYGYLLPIDQKSYLTDQGLVKKLLNIPPLGPLSRLLSSGELFHARSLLGTKGIEPEMGLLVSGIQGGISGQDLIKCNYLTVSDLSPEELGMALSKYIHENALLISQGSKLSVAHQKHDTITAQGLLMKLQEIKLRLAKEAAADCLPDPYENLRQGVKNISASLHNY